MLEDVEKIRREVEEEDERFSLCPVVANLSVTLSPAATLVSTMVAAGKATTGRVGLVEGHEVMKAPAMLEEEKSRVLVSEFDASSSGLLCSNRTDL